MAYNALQGGRDATVQAYPMKANTTINQGSAVVLEISSGFVIVPTGAAGQKFLGWALQTLTSGSTDGDTCIQVYTGPTIKDLVTITGSGSTGILADTDMGKTVYVSGENTYSVVSGNVPCGVLVPIGANRVNLTGASSDVSVSNTKGAIYFAGQANVNTANGQPVFLTVPLTALSAVTGSGDVATSIPLPFAGYVKSWGVLVTTALTGTAKTVTFNLELGSTNVGTTASTCVVASASAALGTYVAASAVSGANTFTAGTLLSIEAASVTAFTGGAIAFIIELRQTGN